VALMTWSSKYSVGVEALDNQHKAMMKALNELHAASMRGEAQKIAGPLLHQLVALASNHFSAEERLMESIKFPGLAVHRAKHKELARMIAEFVAGHERGDSAIYARLLYFVRDWQTMHMQTEDQEYVRWLNSYRVQP
jgi:hemerythrin-like metal-binding protein